MTSEELKTPYVHDVMDVRGVSALEAAREAEKCVIRIPLGGIVEIVCSDPAANAELFLWAEQAGHEVLGTREDRGCWRIFVKRVR